MPSPSRRKLTAEQAAALSPSEFLAYLLTDTIRDTDKARKAGSWQAVATLSRQAAQHRADLDALTTAPTAATEDPARAMSDEELLAGVEDAIDGLPDAALDRIEDRLALRRTGRPVLRVHAGGEGS